MSKALLIIAHGSRQRQANQFVFDQVKALSEKLNKKYHAVLPAFLELGEPDVMSACTSLAQAHISHVDVLPFFLAPGRHVTLDIPQRLVEVTQRFPQLQLQLLPFLGESEALSAALQAWLTD